MSKEHGGPAFPRAAFLGPNGELEAPAQDGMSLLDYFAGQAMQSLVAFREADADSALSCYDIAEIAYDYARHMLAERAKS